MSKCSRFIFIIQKRKAKIKLFLKVLKPFLGLGTRFAELMVFFNPVVFHLSVQDRIALWHLNILGYFFKVVSFVYVTFENCHVAGLVLA